MPTKSQQLKSLNTELKSLQSDLAKASGVDNNIAVKLTTNQARFERSKTSDGKDKNVGKFYMEISITAKVSDVFIPLSMASGKKTVGFLYQIEGTAEGVIGTTEVKCQGEGITEVTVGTLRFAKIPAGKTAIFIIQVSITGKQAKTYTIAITRINYKLNLSTTRYKQYIKELKSRSTTLS